MSSVRVLSRRRLVHQFKANGRYYVESSWCNALERAERRGYVVNPREYGPGEGRVCLIPGTHPLAPIVAAALRGQRNFPRSQIEEAAGGSLSEMEVLRRLADVGLGLLSVADDEVALKAGHPRLTRLVNAARHHLGRRGFDARTVVAAVLELPCQRVKRVSRLQRMQAAARLLDDWAIGAFELLDGCRRVRLRSDWHVNDRSIAA